MDGWMEGSHGEAPSHPHFFPMEPTEPPRGTKRPLPASDAGDEDDDGRAALGQRKPRFPKGKKAKYRDPGAADADGSGEGGAAAAEDIDSLMNPELAAVRRARRRHRRAGQDKQGAAADARGFEVRYEDGANFVDDGIRIEPFNLEQEREEGYFDESGNFVEYARGNEIKDAWLDNVEVDTKYAEKVQKKKDKEEEFQDLSSDDIGKIKKRIANMLEPGTWYSYDEQTGAYKEIQDEQTGTQKEIQGDGIAE